DEGVETSRDVVVLDDIFNQARGGGTGDERDGAAAEAGAGEAAAVNALEISGKRGEIVQLRAGDFVEIAQTEMAFIHKAARCQEIARLDRNAKLGHSMLLLDGVTGAVE